MLETWRKQRTNRIVISDGGLFIPNAQKNTAEGAYASIDIACKSF